MLDWGDELKPRPHSGRIGIDKILKDARRGDLKAVKAHLRRDPSLLIAKSGGHNVPGRIRSEIPVLLKPFCIARRYGQTKLESLLAGTAVDVFSACFLGDSERVNHLLDQDPSLLTEEQDDDTVWRVTPLHHAVAGGHEELARYLIKQGAKVKPYTRLLCNAAVRMGHPHLLDVLLDSGADRQLIQTWGKQRPAT